MSSLSPTRGRKAGLKKTVVNKASKYSGHRTKNGSSLLTLKVLKGTHLLASDIQTEPPTSDPVCFIWCGDAALCPSIYDAPPPGTEGSPWLCTRVVYSTIDPTWNEEVAIPLDSIFVSAEAAQAAVDAAADQAELEAAAQQLLDAENTDPSVLLQRFLALRCLVFLRDEDVNDDGTTTYDELGCVELLLSDLISKGRPLSNGLALNARPYDVTKTEGMPNLGLRPDLGTLTLGVTLTLEDDNMGAKLKAALSVTANVPAGSSAAAFTGKQLIERMQRAARGEAMDPPRPVTADSLRNSRDRGRSQSPLSRSLGASVSRPGTAGATGRPSSALARGRGRERERDKEHRANQEREQEEQEQQEELEEQEGGEEEDVVPEEGEGEGEGEEEQEAAAAAAAEEQQLPPPEGEEGDAPPLDADAVTGPAGDADADADADAGAALEGEGAPRDGKGDGALTQGGEEGIEGKEGTAATERGEEVTAPAATPEAEDATASEGGALTVDPAKEGELAAAAPVPIDQQLDGKESAEAEKDAPPAHKAAEVAQPEVTGSPSLSLADPELTGADAAPAQTEAEAETKAEVVTNSQAPATTSDAPSSSTATAAADDAVTDVGDDEAKREEDKIETPALSRASSKSQLLLPKPSASEPSIAPPISSGTGRAAAAALRDRDRDILAKSLEELTRITQEGLRDLGTRLSAVERSIDSGDTPLTANATATGKTKKTKKAGVAGSSNPTPSSSASSLLHPGPKKGGKTSGSTNSSSSNLNLNPAPGVSKEGSRVSNPSQAQSQSSEAFKRFRQQSQSLSLASGRDPSDGPAMELIHKTADGTVCSAPLGDENALGSPQRRSVELYGGLSGGSGAGAGVGAGPGSNANVIGGSVNANVGANAQPPPPRAALNAIFPLAAPVPATPDWGRVTLWLRGGDLCSAYCEVLDRGSPSDFGRLLAEGGITPSALSVSVLNRACDQVTLLLLQGPGPYTEVGLLFVLAILRDSRSQQGGQAQTLLPRTKEGLAEALGLIADLPSKQGLLAGLLQTQLAR